MALEALWRAFLAFLASLAFVKRWTATIERSLRARVPGRLHLHAFVEFKAAVDWTSLEKVKFMEALPGIEDSILSIG